LSPQDALESAREYASISLSRNHSAFVCDKNTAITCAEETETSEECADFKVVVSADTTYLNWAYDNLKAYNSTAFHGYKTGSLRA